MLTTFYIKTYGCAMNIADSNTIRNLLTSYSLQESSDWKSADLIILLTCSIRQQAEDKVAGWGIKANEEIFEDKIVILTGCMAQRYNRSSNSTIDKYEKLLQKRFPWITHLINIKDINQLPKILGIDNNDLIENPNINFDRNNKYQGLFSISHGCNNFCSYCIVPYTRGKLFHIPKEEILKDIKDFISNGGKLVTLLGQNVNSWEDDGDNIVDLLKEISNIKGKFWINFISSHPKDFSDELIELITTNEKLLKHCHIAAQSGSNRILRLMNRGYTKDRFLNICKKIKTSCPDFRITTDVIVGFPSETEDDFNDSISLIKECRVEMVYIGKFSPRESSVAYDMNDDVEFNVKKDREEVIRKLVNKVREKKHKEWIGKALPVLVISKNKGITYYNHEVLLEKEYKEGSIQNIKIIGYSRSGLVGI
ncbi:MiaB/RimO family radical SAM methylthiotransferase [bacterium]|nr:MiaB/RimO family radical SAM methylthiotransferase [bacterium]